MNSLPTIQDTPKSTNSAIGTGDKSVGWLFTVVAMCCVIALLVSLSLIFRHFQPPSTEQIALFLG
jgi:hypothetical protein